MTDKAAIRKADLKRAAQVANETGCGIEISSGDTVWRIVPHNHLTMMRDQPRAAGFKTLVDMSDDIRM